MLSIAIIFSGVFAALASCVALFLLLTPSAEDLGQCLTTSMYKVELCAKGPNYVPLGQISKHLRDAVLASEDSAFFDHHGIDWVELRESLKKNLKEGRFARGGSTITQQLAKNVYFDGQKSLFRKLKEAIVATRIEKLYSKNQILEKYLNVVEFGKDIYGIKAASFYYFDIPPSQLSVAQSVWLAFLLPNPEKYSVSFHKGKLTPFAHRQMRMLVSRLFSFKKISADEHAAGLAAVGRLFGGIDDDSSLVLTLENSPDWDGEKEASPSVNVQPPQERSLEQEIKEEPQEAE